LVSDNSGEAYEFFLYSPWGESLYEWNSGTASFSSPYRFNGKERDQETGLAYYGARYYDNKISMWLSVDPLAHEFPWQSPYCAMDNNPINMIDPTGMSASPVFGEDGELLGTDSEGWEGEAIVMDKKDFEQGMDHNKALDKGTELSKHGEGIRISDSDWQKVEDNGGTKMTPFVTNNSGSTVYYKPEGVKDGVDLNPGYSNSGAYPIGANQDLYAPVDGVATKKYSDHVLKIPTGASITITSEGGGDIDFYGLGGMGRMALGIGWINKEYITNQNKNDKSWDALFNKAAKIGLTKY
jgi:RHS repeat-associated protein